MLRYTEDHEWLSPGEGGEITVGITAHAAEQLGDIVFVELPEPGTEVSKGDEIVTIESVKAASDITAPIDGTITAINEAVSETPGSVNEDPTGAWFFRIAPKEGEDLDGFMDEAAYQAMIG